jgi:hypothetical protein
MLTTLTQQPGFREQACCRRTENFHLKAPGPKIEGQLPLPINRLGRTEAVEHEPKTT